MGLFPLVSLGGEVPPGSTTPIQVITREAAHYPRLAQKAGIEGIIVLSIPVDGSGKVGQPVVVEPSLPSPSRHLLSWAAIWAAKLSKYQPALENGQPVASTIELTYEFVCPRDSLGHPTMVPATVQPLRRHTLPVGDDRICLYGHWLSGDVEVLQIENRVYVGGIRVYLPCYTREIRSRFTDADLLEDLLQECDWLQRDLLILGKPWAYVDSEVFRLISEYPAPVECAAIGPGRYRVRIGQAAEDIMVMKACPPFDVTDQQERVYLGKAVDEFFKWLSLLESNGMVLSSHFTRSSLGRNNPQALAIARHLADRREKGLSPRFSLTELEDLDLLGEIAEMLREPEWVFRQQAASRPRRED